MEKDLSRSLGNAIVRIDGTIEKMDISEDFSKEEFAIMIATVFGGSKTLLEELKIGEIPRILIKNDECSIELESIDSKRISIKVLKK
ncbi:MAG: hypothetical protein ACP5TO_05180 [Thermoplasmata archaeon]